MNIVLRKGSRGPLVKQLQKKLGITDDGIYGSNTEKAVAAYQKEKNLYVDGVAGENTLKSLKIKTSLYGKEYTGKQIINRVKKLPDYNKIPEGYWIVGVRNPNDHPDQYDDRFYFFKGEELISTTTGTTNPGVKILKGYSSFNKHGAAVVESDRIYHNVWKYGRHRGYMPALRQVGSEITVWRDGDKDHFSEEQGIKMTGYYGINFHTATKNYLGKVVKTIIGGWSAGCQVCNNSQEYMEIINTIKGSKQEFVTYCLLKEF